MTITRWADTSALLHQDGLIDPEKPLAVSTITVAELEHIKDTSDNENIKYKAREAVRSILTNNNLEVIMTDNRKIDKMLKKFPFLSNIPDHRILCAAEIYAIENDQDMMFLTSDALQYLFAMQMPHIEAIYPMGTEQAFRKEDDWAGWGKYYPDETEMAVLYADPKMNILKCKTNEFAEIYEDKTLKDILFWNGTEYRKLKYKDFTAPTGERISPRNIEQKMYLDLLQNDDIPIKLCVGRFGTGKSMFAETWAAHQLQIGKYDKIVFVKNNLEVKGAGKLGILPGDEIDKQYPWLRQIEDHLGPQLFETYLNEGKLEPAHLSTLRGRDLKNCLILVDEAENLLTTNIQLLLGRVGEGSQIIFCADVKQCDYKDSKMSGIPHMIRGLAGIPQFGMVKLLKSERSVVAATADLLD